MTFGSGDSPLERIAALREEATDEYVHAIDAEAEAQNVYLKAHSVAVLTLRDEGTPATALIAIANAMCVEEKWWWNVALATKRSAWAKCDELGDRLMAAQSYFRIQREQT